MKPQVPEGYYAEFKHYRNRDVTGSLSPKGGMTKVLLREADDTGDIAALGFAYCNEADNFNRRIGRDIALGRALKDLKENVAAHE